MRHAALGPTCIKEHESTVGGPSISGDLCASCRSIVMGIIMCIAQAATINVDWLILIIGARLLAGLPIAHSGHAAPVHT